MNYFIHNGSLKSGDTKIVGPANRGFRYGEGVFETMKFEDNRIFFIDDHFHRLLSGLQLLGIQLPPHFTQELLATQVALLTAKNKLRSARVRLMFFTTNGGLYETNNRIPDHTIEVFPTEIGYELNANGLDLCYYNQTQKYADIFANLKQNNFLVYTQAALYARARQCNDAIVFNHKMHICDTTMANIFWIKKGQVFTNPISEGAIAGVFRKNLLRVLDHSDFHIYEMICTRELLEDADEIFTTNVIKGIRWVKNLEGKEYSSDLTLKLFYHLMNRLKISH